jgi:hypothetical protein
MESASKMKSSRINGLALHGRRAIARGRQLLPANPARLAGQRG